MYSSKSTKRAKLGWKRCVCGGGGGLLTQIPSLAKEAAEVLQRGTQGHTETARSLEIIVLKALHWLCCPLLQTPASLKCPRCLPGGHRLVPVFSSLLVASQEERTNFAVTHQVSQSPVTLPVTENTPLRLCPQICSPCYFIPPYHLENS